MPTVAELLAQCPYLEYVTTQDFQGIKEAMIFRCTALQAGAYLTIEAAPTMINGACTRLCGVANSDTEPEEDPWFLERVHNFRKRRIEIGHKMPQHFEAPDFMAKLVDEVMRVGGKAEARQAVLAAIQNGLDATEGQELIDNVIEKAEVL